MCIRDRSGSRRALLLLLLLPLADCADAVLAAKKADSMHVSSILATSFCERAAVATLTSFMATFNLPSSPDVYDDATGEVNRFGPPRTTDPNKLTGQAMRLLAIEIGFSFLSAFAQYRFHDIDLRRPFDGDGERGDDLKNASSRAKKTALPASSAAEPKRRRSDERATKTSPLETCFRFVALDPALLRPGAPLRRRPPVVGGPRQSADPRQRAEADGALPPGAAARGAHVPAVARAAVFF